MLSKQLESTLRLAVNISTEHKHEYTTLEHLLLALLNDSDVKDICAISCIDIVELQENLKRYITHELSSIISEHPDAQPTASFQRVIHRAAIYSKATGHKYVTGAHILSEMFFEQDAYAVLCLKEQNLIRADVIHYISTIPIECSKSIEMGGDQSFNSSIDNILSFGAITNENINQIKGQTDTKKSTTDVISSCCVNLNEKAKLGTIDQLIGRDKEIQRAIEILCRRQKNNIILIGEPGVGKTAIAEGLALRIINKDVPEILHDAVIYSLDSGSLVSGTRYRGDFEERIKNLIQALKSHKKAILFIDEIHTIIGAGANTSGALDASNLLKPALARGELNCIGATTFKEYRNNFEKDMALVRRFQKIIVDEPDEEESVEILQGLKTHYEKHHGVTYSDEVLIAAVSLSERYITDRQLPDKAIDIIDEAGSRKKIFGQGLSAVTVDDIADVVASIANLPSIMVSKTDVKNLQDLAKNLKNVVFGQDTAIDHLCSNIKLSKAGLQKAHKPSGSYLFVGPSGVGKKELAKQLAQFCNMKLIKFDMSEYNESTSISRLIGSSPGYVGFDQGGLLTEKVNYNPYSVILFDEIEKAHPDIMNLLLQIVDEGKLTDSTGKIIDFSNTIIVMTCSMKLRVSHKNSIGFGKERNDLDSDQIDIIYKHFTEEFCNRLDQIIIFNDLGIDTIGMVVDKNLQLLSEQLKDRDVVINIDPSVRSYIITCITESKEGSTKILGKLLDVEIKQKIADEILFGKLMNGGTIELQYINNNIHFIIAEKLK